MRSIILIGLLVSILVVAFGVLMSGSRGRSSPITETEASKIADKALRDFCTKYAPTKPTRFRKGKVQQREPYRHTNKWEWLFEYDYLDWPNYTLKVFVSKDGRIISKRAVGRTEAMALADAKFKEYLRYEGFSISDYDKPTVSLGKEANLGIELLERVWMFTYDYKGTPKHAVLISINERGSADVGRRSH